MLQRSLSLSNWLTDKLPFSFTLFHHGLKLLLTACSTVLSLPPLFQQRASCGNMRPVSKANVLFACPEFTEYDPTRAMTYPPRPDSCCKVRVAVVLGGMGLLLSIKLLMLPACCRCDTL